MAGDLHTHSTCSDGSVPIHRLPLMAARLGLSALALSDHDTTLSAQYAYDHPVQDGVRLIPAAELTGYDFQRSHRVHLLTFWPDLDCPALRRHCDIMRQRRNECALQSCREIEALYPQFRTEQALEYAQDSGVLFKSGIMQALQQLGLCDGIRSFNPVAISGGTVNANGGNSDYSNGGDGIRSLDHVAISGGTVKSNGGSGNLSGGNGIISYDIDLSGSLELTAKAGSPNGKALSRVGSELDLNTIKDKLDPGAKVTATDADGKVIQQVSIPRPVEPEEPSSSSDGGSATPSAPVSSLPGLTVTDKDGQRISYTSTQSGNTLTVCVGRFTASLRASLSTLRQLRAEGIDTITFQTILCSTTLSVDELLAMGGEDAEIVLTHHIRSSTLTVGGRAV